jgi:hypothetical protein
MAGFWAWHWTHGTIPDNAKFVEIEVKSRVEEKDGKRIEGEIGDIVFLAF